MVHLSRICLAGPGIRTRDLKGSPLRTRLVFVGFHPSYMVNIDNCVLYIYTFIYVMYYVYTYIYIIIYSIVYKYTFS